VQSNEGALGHNGLRFNNGSSVAESVASWSSASTGQKMGARQPLGPLTVKRSSQVRHIFPSCFANGCTPPPTHIHTPPSLLFSDPLGQ